MNTTIQLILEQDGDLSLSLTGKPVASNTFVFIDSLAIGSRIKLEILGELHPGLNSCYFLLVQRCHFAFGKLKFASNRREAQTDTPAVRHISTCTVIAQLAWHAWLKTFGLCATTSSSSTRHVSSLVAHYTEHLHFLTFFSNLRPAFYEPLRRSTAAQSSQTKSHEDRIAGKDLLR